jgi:hypothetical protein
VAHRDRDDGQHDRLSREVLASDAERGAVADALRWHCATGRLEVEELEQRLAAALSARTVDQLERLVADLPGRPLLGDPDLGAAHGKVTPGPPGLRHFRQVHELEADTELCFRQALEYMLPMMVAGRFDVISRIDRQLLVFQRHGERVVVAFIDSGHGGTRLVVQGIARRRVRKVFAKLSH